MRRGFLVAVAVACFASQEAFASCTSTFEDKLSDTTSGTVCGIPVTVSRTYTEAELKAATSISGTINGMAVTITSASPYTSMENSNSYTVFANGHTILIRTNAASFKVSGSDNTVTVTVDGTVIYSGVSRSISIEDAINLLKAVGMYDSYAAVQQTVARDGARTTGTLTSTRITQVLAAALSPPPTRQERAEKRKQSASLTPTGVSSGEVGHGVGVWASPANSWISSDDPNGRFAGTMQNLMSGIDWKVTPTSVVGLGVGFERTQIRTSFNRGEVGTGAISLTPYFGTSFFDNFISLDLMGSYAYYDGHQTRTYTGGSAVRGDFTGQRWMLASNINMHVEVVENFTLTTTVGGMAMWDHRFRFYENDGTRPLKNDSGLGEGKLAAKGLYAFETFDLYAQAAFLHAFLQDQDITAPNRHTPRNEVVASIGANWPVGDREIVGAELSNSFAREYTHQTTISAIYRVSF